MDHKIIELIEQCNSANEECVRTLQKYEQAKKQMDYLKEKLNECIVENNKIKYPIVYKIVASPSIEDEDHTMYIVGYMSTNELAHNTITNRSNPNADGYYEHGGWCRCEWKYSIERCNIQTLSTDAILRINKVEPYYFPDCPYCFFR